MHQMGYMPRCAPLLALLASPAVAHHSTAAFDLRTTIEIEGVVTRYEWANPHVNVYLDTQTEPGKHVTWQVEAGSPAVMHARGWSKDSFAIGDEVAVRVNPAQDRTRHLGLVAAAQKKDRALPGLLGPGVSARAPLALPEATGLAGTWVPVVEPAVHQRLRLQPLTLPVTPKGADSIRSFREHSAMNPASKCVAPPAPVLMIVPEVKAIEVSSGIIRIRSEGFGADRLVHMNLPSHDGAPFTAQGHSIGRWQGDVLSVDTARFAPNRVGNAIGLASGSRKHLVERFELCRDGRSLKYQFVLEDPEYLQTPVTGELQWTYRPDLKFSEVRCDLQNARRFSGDEAN